MIKLTCIKCDEEKPETQFHKDKSKKTGRCSTCKECAIEKSRNWSRNNKEKKRETNRRYRAANKEKIKAYKTKYYTENKEKVRRQQRKTITKNKQHYKEYYKKWKENNKEHLREYKAAYNRNRRKSDPVFRAKQLMRAAIYRGIKNKKLPSAIVIGCDWEYLWDHLQFSFEEIYGLDREMIKEFDVHIDHIIPLSAAATEEDVYRLNHYTNLQLLMAEDNLKKGHRYEQIHTVSR